MVKRGFEGSYLDDALDHAPSPTDSSLLECKTCGYIYDPARGDEVGGIPPGTPFSALPEHGGCPLGEGAKEQFLRLEG
jgi:rubredoxin